MIKIAVYGKGGIGKSTTTSNMAAALSALGYRVMLIGCDPKSDSTKCLMEGKKIPTVLDQIREKGADGVELDDIVYEGYNGILCVEAGGPTPGIGCAGRGIITAFEKLEELGAYDHYMPDIVLYDLYGYQGLIDLLEMIRKATDEKTNSKKVTTHQDAREITQVMMNQDGTEQIQKYFVLDWISDPACGKILCWE